MNSYSILLTLFFSLFHHTSNAAIIYVDANLTSGNQDGTSWSNAYANLQDAIGIAVYGDEIWVAQGTYYPTIIPNRNVSFTLKNGVKMYGGFLEGMDNFEDRDWENNPTILSGDIGILGDSTDNSYTIVYCDMADSTTVLDGFILREGNADSNNNFEPSTGVTKSGGALYIIGSSQTEDTRPVISNCLFFKNTARSNGGAVYIKSAFAGGASPLVFDCTFEENTCLTNGGGICKAGNSKLHEMTVESCHFINNISRFGGGIFHANNNGEKKFHINGCKFEQNTSTQAGGAVYRESFGNIAELSIDSCFFENNFSIVDAAIIFDLSLFSSGAFSIRNCLFQSNDSNEGNITLYGEGNVEINYSFFYDNYTIGNGSCILTTQRNVNLNNCIFANSYSGTGSVLNVSGNAPKIDCTSCSFINNIGEGAEKKGGLIEIGVNVEDVTFTNCIFQNNNLAHDGHQIILGESQLTVSNCLFDLPDAATIAEGNVTIGDGMLYNLDPMFADTAAGDFSLLPCSPAINAGDNAIINQLDIITDLAGNPRILSNIVDMGAYEAPELTATVSSMQPSCGNAYGNVQIALQNGCPDSLGNYQVEWSDGNIIGTSLDSLLSGDYSITLTDVIGRTVSTNVTIPVVPAVEINIEMLAQDCEAGTLGTAIVTPSGGTPDSTGLYQYQWNTSASDSLITDLLAGAYSITVFDANNCTDSATVVVEMEGFLTTALQVSHIHCHNSADGTAKVIPLNGAPPYDFYWQNGQMTDSLAMLDSGTYAVTVTDANGCTDTPSFIINAPPELVGNIEGFDVLCHGNEDGIAIATASGGTPAYSFQWSNFVIGDTITNLEPGNYTVTITDMNNCGDTLEINIQEPPVLGMEVEAVDATCFGLNDGFAIAAGIGGTPDSLGNYHINWSEGISGDSLLELGADNYEVTLTDENSCNVVESFTIVEPEDISLDSTVINASGMDIADGAILISNVTGGTPFPNGDYEYLWNTDSMTASISGLLSGFYTLTITDMNGCETVFDFEIEFETDIWDIYKNFEISIFPNPASSVINIQLSQISPDFKSLQLKITNSLGQQVQNQTLNPLPDKVEQIDLTSFENGIYFFSIYQEHQILQTQKVLIQN